MNRIHVTQVNVRSWLAITLASLLCPNLGDFYARPSGLSTGIGLADRGVVALIHFLERRDTRPHEAYSWLTILMIHSGATSVADFRNFRAGFPALVVGWGLTCCWPVSGDRDGCPRPAHSRNGSETAAEGRRLGPESDADRRGAVNDF